MNESIRYDFNKMRVRQYLGSISSLYYLEGSFEEAIAYLEEQKQYYTERFVTNAAKMHANNWKGGYLDGHTAKTVKFDTLIIDVQGKQYEEGNELVIWGERDFLPEELAAYNDQQTKQKQEVAEKEKKELERLKKKYES